MKAKINFRLSAIIFFLLLGAAPAFAISPNFSLSVTPYEGGFDLRYGKVGPATGRVNKELVLRMNTGIAKQYRVIQTLLDPLTNAEGQRIPQNNFVLYGLRGTNRFGILNVEQEAPIFLGRQVLYTSNATGDSDTFTLVYGLIPPENISPGQYRGRISFMLEPIGSNQGPVNVILNIYAEVEISSSIEVITATGSKNIVLNPNREEALSADVTFNIRGGFGKQFRILQGVENAISADGSTFDCSVINFSGKNAQKGITLNQPTPLAANQQQIIYTSSPAGEADSFTLTYSLGDLSKQKAGDYKLRVKYLFEGLAFAGPAMKLIDTLSLEVPVPRIFNLSVTPEMGGGIQFANIKPMQPPRTQEVTFETNSNLAKAYQVTQNMSGLLTDKEGDTIPGSYFTIREIGLDTKGTLKCSEKTELKAGETVLFVSDRNGSPDKFQAIYELSVPNDVHSGDYATFFTYSLSEL